MNQPQYIPEDPNGHPYTPADKLVSGWYVTPDRDRRVHFEEGKISNRNGAAMLYANGGEAWLVEGVFHREKDLPAIIIFDKHGRLAREAWMVNGVAKRSNKENPDAIEYQYSSDDSTTPALTISTWRNNENLISRKHGPAIVIKDHKDTVIRKEFIDRDYGGYHNASGPAIETLKSKFYYFCNKLHREDGPAVDKKNGKEYWLDDKQVEKKDVDALFANGKTMKRDMIKDMQMLKGGPTDPEEEANLQDEIDAKNKARESVAIWAKRANKKLMG